MPVEVLLEQALTEGMFVHTGDMPGMGGAAEVSASVDALCLRLQALQRGDLGAGQSLCDAVLTDAGLTDSGPGGGGLLLSRHSANVLYFCDQLFSRLQAQGDIALPLLQHFLALRPFLSLALLRQPQLLLAADGALTALLDRLWSAAALWYEGLGRQGEKYRGRIETCLDRLRLADPVTAPVQQWLDEFSQQQERDLQRADLLAARICQSERGALAGHAAERAVRRQLNVILQAMLMPADIERLLKEPYRNLLQMIFLREGVNSEAWHRAVKVAGLLLQSVRPPENDEEKQRQYQMIPRMTAMLGEQLTLVCNDAELESWLGLVEALHMRVLMGQEIVMQVAQPLSSVADEAQTGSSVTISEALLEQVSQIAEGQWLLYRREHDGDDDVIRCRLALKLDDVGQLLFVNVLGAKCLEKHFEEFAYLLASRRVRLLDPEHNVSRMVSDTVDDMLRLFQAQSRLRDDAQARKQQQQALRQQQQRAAEMLAAREAASRALEQEAWQQQQALEQRARALEQQKQEQFDAWQRASAAVAHLGIGAWLDLEVDGVQQKGKLAALIRSGERLILVGRDGRKLAELSRDELTGLIIADKAAIIEKGDQFESSLARVIQTLRKD